MKYLIIIVVSLTVLLSGCATHVPTWQESMADAVHQYGPAAEARVMPAFRKAGVAYPPQQVAFLIFKHERRLELWASDGTGWHFIKKYNVLAASGGPGPKLHEGDDQVPEGVYRLIGMNPQSHFHLSLNVNYPNEFDRTHAAIDHRHQLGDDIFIHGNDVSIGCVAIGDKAIEELFMVVYRVGVENVQVVIAPDDLRHKRPLTVNNAPVWLPQLYQQIQMALSQFGSGTTG